VIRKCHDGQLVCSSAEFFPDVPKGMVRVQREGGMLVYSGILHRVVARVIRPGRPESGRGVSGLRNDDDGWSFDILLVEPVEHDLLTAVQWRPGAYCGR
jgi:hypothetical protein